ncbi:MAG TPA: hypothetical protein VI981_05790 [Candidatus Paceibacterota bacterium]
MPFKKSPCGTWVPARTYPLGSAFSAGDWNQGPGGGRFVPAMRKEIDMAEKLENLKMVGATHIEFHNTEAPASEAPRLMKLVTDAGLKVGMVTANLFRLPQFVGGNLGHPKNEVRKAAIEATCAYIAAGIEVFDADVYVYWNGSSGVNVPLGKPYRQTYLSIAESLTGIVRWMVKTYGAERALPICVEPKFNEPPGWGMPADAGEVLAIIALMPEDARPFVGTNIETCHSKIGMKRFAMELALSAASGRNFHIHLNDGSGAKFDEDRPFGFDWATAVETVYTLTEMKYDHLVGIDVQPFPADTGYQQADSIATSVREFRLAQRAIKHIDADILQRLQSRDDDTHILRIFNHAQRMAID